MTDLIKRLEEAREPTRELDRALAKTQGWHRVEPRFTRNKHGGWISPEDFIGVYSDGSPILDGLHGTTIYREVPAYTSSVDAALSLDGEEAASQNLREAFSILSIIGWPEGDFAGALARQTCMIFLANADPPPPRPEAGEGVE